MSIDLYRYLNLSQDLVQAQLPKGAINGIRVDNPSGSWLRMDPGQIWIPPYTIGWQNPLQNALTVSVRWQTIGPSGNVSNATMPAGQQVIVYLTGDSLPHSDGQPSGAATQIPTQPAWQRVIGITCQFTESGTVTVIFPATAGGKNLIVLDYMAAWSLPIGDQKQITRDVIQVTAETTPTLVALGAVAISDAAPFSPLLIPSPQPAGSAGDGLQVLVRSQPGSGRGTIACDFAYHFVQQ